jgi:hypothetical protein
MVCLRNIYINTLHKGDSIFTYNNNNNNNNNNIGDGDDDNNNKHWSEHVPNQ